MPLDQDVEREARRKRPRVDGKPLALDGESVERSQIEATVARAAPEEQSPGSSLPTPKLSEEMRDTFRRIMTRYAANRPNDATKVRRESEDSCDLTRETEFCDIDDGSSRSCKARKVALLASRSVVGLSSFSDEKRIRVCSGCVISSNGSTYTTKILTSATLVRILNANNSVIPDVKIKVCLPNGQISDGSISMVDFHFNIAIVEVKSDHKLPEAILVSDVIKRGDVLAIGRLYDHGGVMCAQGEIRKQASTFECPELLVSSCRTTMAGVGGPLVNSDGHVVGINFYGEDHTPFLSTSVILRCLKHWRKYGKIIRPWLGILYKPLEMLPIRVLERCAYVGKGLYISNVAKGSPADAAGVCVGDVLVECAGKVLNTVPKFSAMLMDMCKEHMDGDTLRSNVSVEVVVRKQSDGSIERKTMSADVLSEFNYYRWVDPLPVYNEETKPRLHTPGWGNQSFRGVRLL
uniref:Uncharacterized protein n=1 Tax=Avena sativa TaxID=4498 RepID=A0ACD5ZCZ0_AVESA